MGLLAQLGRYLGVAVALSGLAFAAAFVGRRSADPMVTVFVDDLAIWMQFLGVLTGVGILVLGVAIYGRMPRET